MGERGDYPNFYTSKNIHGKYLREGAIELEDSANVRGDF